MRLFSERTVTLARETLAACQARGLMVTTAESCTGGLVMGALTEVPGSSAVVERGFVTYSNEAKTELLGVPAELIAREGAVSEAVAIEMALGALERSRAGVAVAITGVAGPGGSAAKPEGLVHFAVVALGHAPFSVQENFGAVGRTQVRLESVGVALSLLKDAVVMAD